MKIFGIVIVITCINVIKGKREKKIHVYTPPLYDPVLLSDYCIEPSAQQTMIFDFKGPSDAIINLVTTDGWSSAHYEIVIGGNANKVCIIRRNEDNSTLTNKEYLWIDNLVNEFEYRQFWESWLEGHIIAGHGHAPYVQSTVIIEWRDVNPLNVSSLYVKSQGSLVEFIIYDTKENLTRFNRFPGKYLGNDVLATHILQSEVECARRCVDHVNCNSFNFNGSGDMCQLTQGRKVDIQENIEFILYFEC